MSGFDMLCGKAVKNLVLQWFGSGKNSWPGTQHSALVSNIIRCRKDLALQRYEFVFSGATIVPVGFHDRVITIGLRLASSEDSGAPVRTPLTFDRAGSKRMV